MKNHKGAVATLLTLGLVVVGTLITLGTSLFVNSKKNIASNPRAEVINCVNNLSGCNLLIKMGECPSGNVATTCTNYKCSNEKYRCPGTADDSSPANPTSKLSPTSTKGVGSGNNWPQDPAQGYNKTLCPKANLEFACCVKDKSSCGGEPRYRWYGCTGQPCGNTKINNSYGQLFGCPAGVNSSNTSPEQGICEGQLTPTKAPVKTCGEYNQGDYFCSGNNQMWCDNEVKKKITTCETGCKDGNCISGTTTNTCTPHLGFNCSSGGYTNSKKTFNYYKSTAKGCESNTVGGSCYGTTSTSCSTEWNAFLKSQCDANSSAGVINCTDADYTELADSSCGASGWCEPKQKKYKKSSNNTCTPVSQVNSEFKCKNDSSCGGNPPANEVSPAGNNITLNPSSQCTNSECLDPNKGIFYSYKCDSLPQAINGVTQCSNYSFYEGNDCITSKKRIYLNLNNVQQKYCNADYLNVKRPVTITYTVDQSGAININTTDPTLTLSIFNNYGLIIFNDKFTVGSTSFPVSKSTTINTGTNLIKGSLSFKNSSGNTRSLPCQSVNVVNGKVNITCIIR